jgi:hypothetical protein
MSSQIVLNASENFANVISYTKPKLNNAGGKSVGIIIASEKCGLKLELPKMMSWGLSDYEGNQKYDLSLQFPSPEYMTPELQTVLDNFVAFEAKIKADALTNSKEWFGKVYTSPDVVDALWSPTLKYTKDKATGDADKTKSPSLRVKVGFYDEKWKVNIFNEKLNLIFPDEMTSETPLTILKKGVKIETIVQCGGIWLANGKFGVTWKMVQCIAPDSSSNQESLCLFKPKPLSMAKNDAVSVKVEDSDDEDIPPVPLLRREQSIVPPELVNEIQEAQEQPETNVDSTECASPQKKKKVVKKKE